MFTYQGVLIGLVFLPLPTSFLVSFLPSFLPSHPVNEPPCYCVHGGVGLDVCMLLPTPPPLGLARVQGLGTASDVCVLHGE